MEMTDQAITDPAPQVRNPAAQDADPSSTELSSVHEAARAPSPVVQLWKLLTRQKTTIAEFTGYDPFVQVFGRSLPALGDPRAVAGTISQWEALE